MENCAILTIGGFVIYAKSQFVVLSLTMAPAAARTIGGIVRDLQCSPTDFDMIVTGDLGFIGSDILKEYIYKDCGVDISAVHTDCGKLIYYRHEQDVHSGGSGCGCSASMLCSHFLNALEHKKLKRILFVATGALLSPLTVKQKESVPSIAHAVVLEGK